uniref:Uncharacterized protein n=1 Tax=Anopheles christyi TaxID=43041 RepID=A0A182KHR8_9DIPT
MLHLHYAAPVDTIQYWSKMVSLTLSQLSLPAKDVPSESSVPLPYPMRYNQPTLCGSPLRSGMIVRFSPTAAIASSLFQSSLRSSSGLLRPAVDASVAEL